MDYYRKATANLPAIIMDSGTKSALIRGVSLSEDSKVYQQLSLDIEKNLESTPYTDLNVQLSVFNVKAARLLLEVFRTVKSKRPSLMVHWLYDCRDEEMKEMGKDYSELLGMEFDISPN